MLRALPHGRLGTLAILGNHDYGSGWSRIDVAARVASVVTDAGATVLRNEVREVGGIQFAGLGDYWSPEFVRSDLVRLSSGGARRALASLKSDVPTVVLCHNPDAVGEAGICDGVRGWVLVGHTHGGGSAGCRFCRRRCCRSGVGGMRRGRSH